MLAVVMEQEKGIPTYHIARGDFTLGEYTTKTFSDLGKLQKYILMLRPSEIILDTDMPCKEDFISPIQQYLQCLVSVYAVPYEPLSLIGRLAKVQQSGSFGMAVSEGRASALALLFSYLQHTQQQSLTNISKIRFHSNEGLVLMDETTVKNLELFASSYENSGKYSLLGVLDKSKTAGGSRYFKQLLTNPINDKSELAVRLSYIDAFLTDRKTVDLHQFLGNFFDIPKLVSLILYRKISYVPFLKLRTVLRLAMQGMH